MAFPTIPTTAASRVLTGNQLDSSATRTFPNLSGLTKNSGDLLIAIVVGYQSNATANAVWSGWTAGWTEFVDYSTTTGMCIGAAYKWSTGSETGTISVTQAATITGDASMILLSIAGAHASTPPEGGSGAQGTSSAADPASFNPTGWDVDDTLWISVVGSGMDSGTGSWTGTGTTAPTNFTDRVDTNASDTSTAGDCEAAVSFRQQAAASQDVGTAGVDTSNARNAALVIAVRPVPPPAAVPTDVRVSFSTPSTNLTGSQEFRALVRRKEASAPAVNPTVAIELWESGAKVADVVTGVSVTSSAGQVASGTWAATALSAISGANVECKVISAGSSLGTVEVGAIEWNLTRVAAPEVTGTAAASLGALTATAAGAVDHPGSVSLDLGAFTAAASATVEHFGTITAALGGITGTATGVRETAGSATAALGVTATAAGVRETAGTAAASGEITATAFGAPDRAGVATVALDGLTATAAGVVVHPADAGVDLGFTATATGLKDVFGVISANLGGAATAVGVVEVPAQAVANLGALTAAGAGFPDVSGAAVAVLGGVTASATGLRTVVGSAVADIGITATVVGLKDVFGVGSASLGVLSASASNLPIGQADAPLGGLTATVTGGVGVTGTAALVASFTAVASGARTVPGAATSTGSLTATAAGLVVVPGLAAATSGLSATAVGIRTVLGVAAANLGGATAAAAGTPSAPEAILAQAPLGTLTATAGGWRQTFGTATSAIDVELTATGVRGLTGIAQGVFGGIGATAAGYRETSALTAMAELGALTAFAVGSTTEATVGVAIASLGPFDAAAIGLGVRSGSGSVALSFVAVAIAFPHQIIRSPRAGIPIRSSSFVPMS